MKFNPKINIGSKARRKVTRLMRLSRKKIGRIFMYLDWLISDFIQKIWFIIYFKVSLYSSILHSLMFNLMVFLLSTYMLLIVISDNFSFDISLL